MRMRAAAVTIVITALVATLSACTPVTPPGPHPTDSPASHQRWGLPAKPAPPGMTYQPDVKVVGGGRTAVWGASSDGIRWTLDANAPGMSDVRVGDVLYASTMTVGRVVTMSRQGDRDIVTMLPVPITDVIKDGRQAIDQTIKPGERLLSQRIDTPTVQALPPSSDSRTLVQSIASVSSGVSSKPMDPPAYIPNGGSSFSVKGFEIGVTAAPDGFNISLSKGLGKKRLGEFESVGLKAGIDIGLHFSDWRLTGSETFKDGKVVQSSTAMKGLKTITCTLLGGAADPATDNTRYRVEVPYTIEEPLAPVAGIPTMGQLRITLIIATAFTGKNATIEAQGAWNVTSVGDVFKDIALSVKQSLLNSIHGISLGPSAVVFGVGVRFLWGVGFPGLAAGPYGKFTVTVGVANGSALGAPLTRCTGATLDISGGGGASAFASTGGLVQYAKYAKEAAKAVHIAEKWLDFEVETSAEYTTPLFHRDVVSPDLPICKAP